MPDLIGGPDRDRTFHAIRFNMCRISDILRRRGGVNLKPLTALRPDWHLF